MEGRADGLAGPLERGGRSGGGVEERGGHRGRGDDWASPEDARAASGRGRRREGEGGVASWREGWERWNGMGREKAERRRGRAADGNGRG